MSSGPTSRLSGEAKIWSRNLRGSRLHENTSVGVGQVLEFYMNFAMPGVLAGFAVLGFILMRLDQGVMRALAVRNIHGVVQRGLPGLAMLAPMGNLLEIFVAVVSAIIASQLLVHSKLLGSPPTQRSNAKMSGRRAGGRAAMTRRLRVAIATAGRFHVLDLARELNALGYAVDFYSYVPKTRAMRFGLPSACHRSLLPFALPALALERFAPAVPPSIRERFLYKSLNLAVMTRLRACDLFIGMSGIYLEAARFAKRRFGAAIWLERGSRHILSQDEILAAIPSAGRPSSLAIDRELAGYALADRIVIPSLHVEESFRRDPAAHAKLFVNPYGVDLEMFPSAAAAQFQQGVVSALCRNVVAAKGLRPARYPPWRGLRECGSFMSARLAAI